MNADKTAFWVEDNDRHVLLRQLFEQGSETSSREEAFLAHLAAHLLRILGSEKYSILVRENIPTET